MLKSIFSGFRTVFLPSFSLKGVLGTRELKETGSAVKDMAKDAFTFEDAKRKETFTEALKRFKLTPDQVADRYRQLMRFAILFFVLALGAFGYAVYLAISGDAVAFMLGLAVSGLGLTYAFRYHFWAFQLKHQKLGCTLKEWWNGQIETSDTTAVDIKPKKAVKNNDS